jgi:hypothetical protein
MPRTRQARKDTYTCSGSAEIRGDDRALGPDRRDAIFGRLRPLLPAGRGRIVIGPGLVRVEQVPADLLPVVEQVLATIARDLEPRPAQRREVA